MSIDFILAAGGGHGPALLNGASPLLLTAVIIIVGSVAGVIAHKFKLPALTGQIIAGVFIGVSGIHLMGHEEEQSLSSITSFAIGLIAVTVGAHLNFRLLHNSLKRILQIAIAESLAAFLLVFFTLDYFNPLSLEQNLKLPIYLLIASLACATSPASSLHVIKEKKAKGILVKTMIAVIAIDNLICMAIFEGVRAFAKLEIGGASLLATVIPGVSSFLIAGSIGFVVGFGLHAYSRFIQKKYHSASKSVVNSILFTIMMISIMLCHGLCEYLKFLWESMSFGLNPSSLLANMVMGVVLANTSDYKDHLLEQFEVMEQAVFTCFFTLAGMHLNLESLTKEVLLTAGIYLGAMCLGKGFGASGAAWAGAATGNISKYIGRTLLVQGGLTIALVIIISEDSTFAAFSSQITAAVLACVVATELIGTVLISKTLDDAKESGNDRTRLIEFLQEEYILPCMFARDRFEAIEELCHFMVKTHKMKITAPELYELVKAREEEMPTGIGEGIAVPHARLDRSFEDQDKIKGVLALASPPVDFGAPDDKPSELIILVITPEEHSERHLEVIGAIARMMQHTEIRDAILNAKSAAEIHEILHSEEGESFNYFLHN
ncbi:MAG: PTS sugar transporter subunit IIA [Lentisphaerales bacterium]|nr:PTS sugar transporter subunit IIA [Lentisphaerales bacterium]